MPGQPPVWLTVGRMHSFRFNTDHFPLVLVTLGQNLAEDEQEAMFTLWEGLIARGQTMVALTDARALRSMGTAKQRARTAEWTRSIDDRLRRVSLGHATVLSNPLVRGAMTAITWLHKPSVPQAYVGTMLEGVDWCVERLRSESIPVGADLLEYRSALAKESA